MIDSTRHECQDEKYVPDEGYFILADNNKKIPKENNFWHIYKSYSWHTIRTISCRFLMIFYSFYLIIETYEFLNESITLFNLIYSLLIVIDCFIVIFIRKGLEDRWCSLSILFFICANSSSLWTLEIFYNSLLSSYIYHPDFELPYKSINSSLLRLVNPLDGDKIDLEKIWNDDFKKENYFNIIGKYEVLFCITLILCRLFMPQATLTWSAISTTCEFSFNTIFDVYSTMSLCRDPKLSLSYEIILACLIISNGALMSISLNLFADSDDDFEFKVSLMRYLTDNLYFRLIIQILFADLPFLILRLIILKLQTQNKPDIYYLIAKQVIIVLCKILFMAYHFVKNTITKFDLDQIDLINSVEL